MKRLPIRVVYLSFLWAAISLSLLISSRALASDGVLSTAVANPLIPPVTGKIAVAYLGSENTTLIDIAGPWEVFGSTFIPSRDKTSQMPFEQFTVAETIIPIHASGVKRTPDYTFLNAPMPKILVIPAQEGRTPAMLRWIQKVAKKADLTISICTGAFLLARTGLLSGKLATTYHGSYRATRMHNLRNGGRSQKSFQFTV